MWKLILVTGRGGGRYGGYGGWSSNLTLQQWQLLQHRTCTTTLSWWQNSMVQLFSTLSFMAACNFSTRLLLLSCCWSYTMELLNHQNSLNVKKKRKTDLAGLRISLEEEIHGVSAAWIAVWSWDGSGAPMNHPYWWSANRKLHGSFLFLPEVFWKFSFVSGLQASFGAPILLILIFFVQILNLLYYDICNLCYPGYVANNDSSICSLRHEL